MSSEKLSIKTKLGYAVGTAGDSLPYNLFATYFLFYMTDVAGINPAAAGIVSSVAMSWDALTYPVVGYLSDKSDNPNGRRTPWMVRSIWLLAIMVFLMFFSVPLAENLKVVYYLIVAVVMWTAFTCYNIPWAALGAELTQDYNERNNLRMMVSVVAVPFGLLTTSGPMYIVNFFGNLGYSKQFSWAVVGFAAGIIVLLFGLLCWNNVRGKEQYATTSDKVDEGILKSFIELLGIRTYRILVAVVALYSIGFAFYFNTNVYVMKYSAGMSEIQQAVYWTIYTVAQFFILILIMKIADKIGKNACLLLFGTVFCVVAFVFFVKDIKCFSDMLMFGLLTLVGTGTYYSIIYSFIYDCSEIDEYIYGKRREASLISCAQFILKIGIALANAATGFMLSYLGYAGTDEVSGEVIRGLLFIQNIIPVMIIVPALILFLFYPVNRKSYNELLEALSARKEGREYSEEGFNKLIR